MIVRSRFTCYDNFLKEVDIMFGKDFLSKAYTNNKAIMGFYHNYKDENFFIVIYVMDAAVVVRNQAGLILE